MKWCSFCRPGYYNMRVFLNGVETLGSESAESRGLGFDHMEVSNGGYPNINGLV